MDAPPNVNPYQPMAAAASDGGAPKAPRWLAVIVSFLAVPLSGAGLLVLRRRRRDLLWPAAGVLLSLLSALLLEAMPALAISLLVVAAAVGIAGIVVTPTATAGTVTSKTRLWLLAVALV